MPSTPSERDGIWTLVDAEPGRVVAGAAKAGSDDTGAVYVYELTGQGWSFAQTVLSPAASSGERFGFSLALDGPRLRVGAPEFSEVANKAGAAYVTLRLIPPIHPWLDGGTGYRHAMIALQMPTSGAGGHALFSDHTHG